MPRTTPDAWKPSGVENLEPAASQALRHDGSACVVAGPGAGKTEFLAQRACFLLDTGECRHPKRILAISFKRDAATNLGRRVRSRTGDGATRFVSMTFDQFTKGIVDRFRASLRGPWALTGPYDLRPELGYAKSVEYFLDGLAGAADEWKKEVYGIPRNTFLSEQVGSYRLPPEPEDPTSAEEFAVTSWWESLYLDQEPQRVEFTMLNRLAELIIRSTPQIRLALRLTYPYAFVDEFQDTTFAQYDFLRSVFGDGSTIVTAVGDNKQRIMGFAGAMPDAFDKFQTDFDAEPFELRMNYRSSHALIAVQHVVACALDDSTTLATSGNSDPPDGDAAQIWCFTSEDDEGRYVSQWIADDIAASGRAQTDYALLTKQKAEDFEQQLTLEFAQHGLILRNDSARIGKTTLQDLLVDDLTLLVLALIRLAATRRNPIAWNHVCSTIALSRGTDPFDDTAARTVGDTVSDYTKRVRKWLIKNPPTPDNTDPLIDNILKFVDRDAVRRAFISYRDSDAIHIAEDALRKRLRDVAVHPGTWSDLCDRFDGVNAVPLMTVHKSKGLEYHTVVFLGIDDKNWWSHAPGQTEGQALFFVGLSRAKQRAMFTFCAQRGTRDNVDDLYDLLRNAGVTEYKL